MSTTDVTESSTLTFKDVAAKLPVALKDLALLKSPTVDAGILATVVAVVSPFGLNVGPEGAYITGGLLAVGTIAVAVETAIEYVKKS